MDVKRGSARGMAAAALIAIAGTAIHRFDVTLTGQTVIAGEGYTPHVVEIAIQVGVIAAAACAWILAVRRLPVLARAPSEGASSPA